jgi:hypothetical protein
LAFFDADDYYWEPSDPPFKEKRPPALRFSTLIADLDSALNGAVVSGSIMNWGLSLEDSFAVIVFLTVPAPIRVERLRARELERFGRIDPEFLEWGCAIRRRLHGRPKLVKTRTLVVGATIQSIAY